MTTISIKNVPSLTDTLNQMSNRQLWPLVKRIGLSRDAVQGAGYTHYPAMPKTRLIELLIAQHGEQAIWSAINSGESIEAPKTTSATTGATDDAAMLANIVRRLAAGSAGVVDEEAVRAIIYEERAAIVNEAVEAARATAVTTIRVERQDAPTIDVGVQHRMFPVLLKTINARIGNGRRLNLWLHGPAGTGKTSAARAAAQALGLKFYYSGSVDTPFQLLGYTDANGQLVRTTFRDAWEHGGVFLLDEVDASAPQALAAMNAAVDGGVCAFPDGMVERHPDFCLIAGANTLGVGGDAAYAGRVRQDAAFLSRYVTLHWGLDRVLEEAIVGDDDAARTMLREIRRMRDRATEQKINGASLTSRAILDGAALLRAGLELPQVLEMVARKGLPEETWARLSG